MVEARQGGSELDFAEAEQSLVAIRGIHREFRVELSIRRQCESQTEKNGYTCGSAQTGLMPLTTLHDKKGRLGGYS
jgi:hypothetical protein